MSNLEEYLIYNVPTYVFTTFHSQKRDQIIALEHMSGLSSAEISVFYLPPPLLLPLWNAREARSNRFFPLVQVYSLQLNTLKLPENHAHSSVRLFPMMKLI